METSKTLITESTGLLATTGFVFTKFSSNPKKVLDGPDQEHLTPQLKTISSSKTAIPQQQNFGVYWDEETDQLQLHQRKANASAQHTLTRRSALSYFNSRFDPLELWCSFFVMLKLCFSKIVTRTVDWDDEIGHEFRGKMELVSQIDFLSLFTFPRQHSNLNDGKYEVSLFTDASNYAMGAFIY